VYDDEGYNQAGYHRDTGLNRTGNLRAVDALDSDEIPIENVAVEENNGNTERGHIHMVPYLGRVVSTRAAAALPIDMQSLRASLVLTLIYILTGYGLIVLLHNGLAARGYA
jgi:hypothetical protein